MTADKTTDAGAAKWGLWRIFCNVAFGVVIGVVVIVVSVTHGKPVGILVGLFMIAVGGYYAWRAWQGRQLALRGGNTGE